MGWHNFKSKAHHLALDINLEGVFRTCDMDNVTIFKGDIRRFIIKGERSFKHPFLRVKDINFVALIFNLKAGKLSIEWGNEEYAHGAVIDRNGTCDHTKEIMAFYDKELSRIYGREIKSFRSTADGKLYTLPIKDFRRDFVPLLSTPVGIISHINI